MKNNLMNLAKGSNKKKSTTATKTINTIVEDEDKDIKAKKLVDNLLKDIPIFENKTDKELLIVDENVVTTTDLKNVEWLEEQITLLTEENSRLKQMINDTGEHVDDQVRIKVIELFNELQTNHIKLGVDPVSGIGNFRIYCPGFLNRMIKFFPFLDDIKRY